MFGIVYSTTTGRVRSYSSTGMSGAQITNTFRIGTGEAWMMADDAQYGALPAIQAIVTAATGKTPANDRYALVDGSGNVVGAVIADPVGCGDTLTGLTLVASATASNGWLFDVTDGLVSMEFFVSPKPGTYVGSKNMVILFSNSKVSAVYTLDGSDPTTSLTALAFVGILAIPSTITVKISAKYKGKFSSPITIPYVIQ